MISLNWMLKLRLLKWALAFGSVWFQFSCSVCVYRLQAIAGENGLPAECSLTGKQFPRGALTEIGSRLRQRKSAASKAMLRVAIATLQTLSLSMDVVALELCLPSKSLAHTRIKQSFPKKRECNKNSFSDFQIDLQLICRETFTVGRMESRQNSNCLIRVVKAFH